MIILRRHSPCQAGGDRKGAVPIFRLAPSEKRYGPFSVTQSAITSKRQGGSLKLLHLAAHVRELLVITRLLTIFDAYGSETAAVASFGPSAPA